MSAAFAALAAAVICLPPCASSGTAPQKPPPSVRESGLKVVELADEGPEIERGLMFRRELCDTCGMLFAYGGRRVTTFWMKNTYLPLDMIFMDGDGTIVTIHEDTVPLREHPTYRSTAPVRYVLEVNAGYAREKGLKVGQRISIDALRAKLIDYRWK